MLLRRRGIDIIRQMAFFKEEFMDLEVQCQDGVLHSQRLILSKVSPLLKSYLQVVEEPLLILPDNSCEEVTHLLDRLWDQEGAGDLISERSVQTYHWVDFTRHRNSSAHLIFPSEAEEIATVTPSDTIKDPLKKSENFEEKFSQFLKQFSLEGYSRVEANRTFEIIAKHLSSTLNVQILDDEQNTAQGLGKKVQTIPMDVESYHSQEEPYTCLPGRNVPDSGHSFSSTGKRETCQCSHCGKVLSDRSSLKIHEEVVHLNVRRFRCEQCGKRFGHKADLSDHVQQVHVKIKQFICDLCGTALSSRQGLTSHRLVHQRDSKNFNCKLCGNSFRHKSTLKKHMSRVHEFDQSKLLQCDKCQKTFKHEEGLKRHTKKMHFDKASQRFPCTICAKTFSFNYDLNKHMKVHNNRSQNTVSFPECYETINANVVVETVQEDGNGFEFENIVIDTEHVTLTNENVGLISPNINSILGQ